MVLKVYSYYFSQLSVDFLDNGVITQPTFRRRINIVSTLWIDVGNETKSDIGFSTLPNVDTTSVPDVETMLIQCYIKIFATYLERWLN